MKREEPYGWILFREGREEWIKNLKNLNGDDFGPSDEFLEMNKQNLTPVYLKNKMSLRITYPTFM